jgi:hypothetical protein
LTFPGCIWNIVETLYNGSCGAVILTLTKNSGFAEFGAVEPAWWTWKLLFVVVLMQRMDERGQKKGESRAYMMM